MKDWKCNARAAGLLWLRILTGATIAYIGYGKVFGGQIQMLIPGVKAMGFPAPVLFAWLASLSEFLGGILIVLGLGTRVAGLFLAITMFVACFIAQAHSPALERIPAFLYLTIASSLILMGAGRFSIDALLCRRCCKDATEEPEATAP